MPFRPTAEHRKNVQGVIYPLTAAVAKLYGIRADGAYPIGAFYSVNIDLMVWQRVGGIWYKPFNEAKITNRNISEDIVDIFADGIRYGRNTILRSGKVITWEKIPSADATALPSPLET
jgi:hypothetical protein